MGNRNHTNSYRLGRAKQFAVGFYRSLIITKPFVVVSAVYASLVVVFEYRGEEMGLLLHLLFLIYLGDTIYNMIQRCKSEMIND